MGWGWLAVLAGVALSVFGFVRASREQRPDDRVRFGVLGIAGAGSAVLLLAVLAVVPTASDARAELQAVADELGTAGPITVSTVGLGPEQPRQVVSEALARRTEGPYLGVRAVDRASDRQFLLTVAGTGADQVFCLELSTTGPAESLYPDGSAPDPADDARAYVEPYAEVAAVVAGVHDGACTGTPRTPPLW